MELRNIGFFVIMLGIIVLGLGMTVWGYYVLPIHPNENDVFLGVGIFGVLVVIVGFIIWVNSFLPPERFD